MVRLRRPDIQGTRAGPDTAYSTRRLRAVKAYGSTPSDQIFATLVWSTVVYVDRVVRTQKMTPFSLPSLVLAYAVVLQM